MAGPARELVQIEANEDINSVRDRLTFIRGRRVLLIWPEEGTALTRKLDLVLIQREAMRRAIRLALVTHDPQVIKYATELNISTFETIGASERGRWKRGRSKVFTGRFQRPKDEPDAEDLMEVASRVRGRRVRLPRFQRLLVRLVVGVGLIGVVLTVLYVVVPGATVVLVPNTQLIEASEQITVSADASVTDIDVENAILPATTLRLQVEETATTNTTGSRDLGNVQAIGTVVFVNNTDNEITIPIGTTVSTSAGTPIMFRTTVAVVLPAGVGQQIEAQIEALPGSEGDVGNVAENLINTVVGPEENNIRVNNLLPTSGGQSRTEQAVTTADQGRLLGAVTQQLYERALAEMVAQVGETQVVIVDTLRIDEEQQREDWIAFSAEPGDITDTLSVTMRAVVEGVIVDTQMGQQIVFARMADQILRGRVVIPESIEYWSGDVELVDNEILYTMSGRMQVAGQIPESQIREQLAGRTLDDAVEYLLDRADLAEGSTPEIVLSLSPFDRMPILPMRIDIIVENPVPTDDTP